MRATETKWHNGKAYRIADRTFFPGDLVRFDFPSSQQVRQNGRSGYVVSVWNDSRCQVFFGTGIPITINTDYLMRI